MRFAPKTEKELVEENLIPEGVYPFEVTTAVETQSKKGNDMIKMFVKVFKPDGSFIVVTDYLMEAMMFKLLHFCEATGNMALYESGQIKSDSLGNINEFVGAKGECKISIRKSDDYPDQNQIKDYVVSDDGEKKAPTKKEMNTAAQQPLDDEIPFQEYIPTTTPITYQGQKPMTQQINLSKLQYQAVQSIKGWIDDDSRQVFVLGGYAGSGKTTLAARLSEKLGGGKFCAYTGKAAMVLQQKGLPATTIHSLLYQYEGVDPATKEIQWSLKNEDGTYLIVDECSMLNEEIVEDLKASYKKILFLGDPAQLPPIGKGEQVLKPDFVLTEVHRQGADSPILQWASKVRNGVIPYREMNESDMFIVKKIDDITDDEMINADQVIVGRNKTRHDINNYMRDLYGRTEKYPVKGDKMICLKNNNEKGLVNGQTFTCERDAYNQDSGLSQYYLDFCGGSHKVWDGDIFEKPSKEYQYYSKQERVDYGYAITCHKAQGSEYDSIVIINESWGKDKLNWLYTAITRGKKKVILAHP